MYDIPLSSYSAKGITENIEFYMETPCWGPLAPEGPQYGGRKPVVTSGVYFGSPKTFLLSVKLKNIRIGTSINLLVTHSSKT